MPENPTTELKINIQNAPYFSGLPFSFRGLIIYLGHLSIMLHILIHTV